LLPRKYLKLVRTSKVAFSSTTPKVVLKGKACAVILATGVVDIGLLILGEPKWLVHQHSHCRNTSSNLEN